jgi:hypothetical protein
MEPEESTVDVTIIRPRRPGTDWPRADDPRWGDPPVAAAPPQDHRHAPAAPGLARDPDLGTRLAALGRAASIAARYATPVQAPAIPAAAELAARGQSRLALQGEVSTSGWAGEVGTEFTVVALAGPTGVGKSSLFNALTGLDLSPAGHLRPTTGEAYACVWGDADPAALLDWLGVAPQRRFRRESPLDAEDEAALRGLVLVDLPDLDSIATGNRIEADRLLQIVDRVIWVLDPQKYADQAAHEYWRQRMGALLDATVVVLNQADLLTAADADRCRADLARLVEAQSPPAQDPAKPAGSPAVPVIAASARTGDGVGDLRGLLEKVVADRLSAVARLESELAEAVASLSRLVPEPGPGEQDLSDAVPELAEDLVAACGVDALAADAAAAGRPRWPWAPARTAPPIPPADPAAVGQAVRRLAERLGQPLPAPWSRQLRTAATMDLDRLPEELAQALTIARGLRSPAWLPGRHRRVVARRLRAAVLTVAREVVAPVRQVLRDYRDVQAALEQAKAPAAE